MPKISVIIPVYNVEKYVAECLDSVLIQTLRDIEIICVNDGSTDNSLDVLQRYATKDERIKIINQQNAGVVTARNKGISKAKSEYIYTLDSDDIITSDCLEKLYNAMVAGKGDIITSRVMCFGSEDHEFNLLKPTKYNMSIQNCLVNAALFRKNDFLQSGGFDRAFDDGLEDYDFWLNMLFKQHKKIYRVPEILFQYRLKDKSESRNYQKRIVFDKLIKYMHKKYPEMKAYITLHKFIKPFKKIARFIFRFENHTIKICKIIHWYIKSRKSIDVVYFNARNNFGDLLNIDIVQSLSGLKVRNSDVIHADLIAVGSLLQMLVKNKMNLKEKVKRLLNRPLVVWGTGFQYDSLDKEVVRRLDVRAVRGAHSLKLLQGLSNVKIADNVVLADPGLLSGLLVDHTSIKKIYKLGIIPHYVDQNSKLLSKIKVNKSIVIDITQKPINFMRQIAECENIISSAMHGLIAADSLGIPNVRMILSDKIIGNNYKYDDYYSSFGIKKHKKIDLRNCDFTEADVDALQKNYKITIEQVQIKQKALLKSFPYKKV